MRKLHSAYLAGFLDGEGTIGFSVGLKKADELGPKPSPRLRVAFSNFDKVPLNRIKDQYGGSLSINKNYVWALHMNGQAAYQLLADSYKYILIKRRSARYAITAHEGRKNYVHFLKYAILTMEATRLGYKAVRSRKSLDRLIARWEAETKLTWEGIMGDDDR